MNHGISHIVWMGVIFVALFVVGKIFGISLIVFFPLICMLMMVAMMFTMNHGEMDHKDMDHKDHENKW